MSEKAWPEEVWLGRGSDLLLGICLEKDIGLPGCDEGRCYVLASALAQIEEWAMEVERDQAQAAQTKLAEVNAEAERLSTRAEAAEEELRRLAEALATIALGNPDCCRETGVPPRGWCDKCIARAVLKESQPMTEPLDERVERLEAELVEAEAAVKRKRDEDGP